MLVHSSEQLIQQKLLNNIRTMCLTFSKSTPCDHIWLIFFMGLGGSTKGRRIQPLKTSEVDHTGSWCYHTIILYHIWVWVKRERSRIYTASWKISSTFYWPRWLILHYHKFWQALVTIFIKRTLCNPTNIINPLPHYIITLIECPIEFSGAPIESIMGKPVELEYKSLVGDSLSNRALERYPTIAVSGETPFENYERRWRTTISLPPR